MISTLINLFILYILVVSISKLFFRGTFIGRIILKVLRSSIEIAAQMIKISIQESKVLCRNTLKIIKKPIKYINSIKNKDKDVKLPKNVIDMKDYIQRKGKNVAEG